MLPEVGQATDLKLKTTMTDQEINAAVARIAGVNLQITSGRKPTILMNVPIVAGPVGRTTSPAADPTTWGMKASSFPC